MLKHKKGKVDKAFEILGSIAVENSIEDLDKIKKELKKIEGAELPEELSHGKLSAKIDAIYKLRKAIDDEPKASVAAIFDKDASLLTDIGRVLKALQDLIPEDGDVKKMLHNEQIAAYEKLKVDVKSRELALLVKQALLQDDKGSRWSATSPLSTEEEDKIKGASSKTILKEFQEKFRQERNDWKNFFDEHKIIELEHKNFWKGYEGGLDEAKKVYQAALTNPFSEDFPWSEKLSEEDKTKINHAKSPDDIKERQKEVAWDQFFRINGIVNDRQSYWNPDSELTVKQAIKVVELGWKETVNKGKNKKSWGKLIDKEFQRKATINSKEIDIVSGILMYKHSKEGVNKVFKLVVDIYNQTDLTALPGDSKIEDEYKENEVPDGSSYVEVKKIRNEKKLELFKNAFEGTTSPIGISDNDLKKWLNEETGLSKMGTEERTAFDNGWTKPNEIRDRKTNFTYNYADSSHKTIEIEVLNIAEIDLQNAFWLKENIENEQVLADLEQFVIDNQTSLDDLDGKQLPVGWRKEDIKNLISDKKNILANKQFINDFSAAPGSWKRTSLPNDIEIINYKKGSITAAQARQIYEHYWEANEFNWNGTQYNIASYGSHGQNDVNLNALEISKEELNTVNEIIKKITEAKKINALPQAINNYDQTKVPANKNHLNVGTRHGIKHGQIKVTQVIRQIKDYWSSLGMKGDIKTVCGDNWENNLVGKPSSVITAEESRLKNLIKEAKVQPDIVEIEAELNKKPAIAKSELKNSDYESEMLNLVTDDSQRAARKQAIITEISQIRNTKLEPARQIITQAQETLAKSEATKEEVESAINDLKVLLNAATDSAEKVAWEEKSAENQKLLTDLETKLIPLTEDHDDETTDHQPSKDEVVLPPTPDQPLTPIQKAVYGEDYQELKPQQQAKRKKVIDNYRGKENKENHRESSCSACQKTFPWDMSLAFYPARKKAQKELKDHQKTCSLKDNPTKIKEVLQDKWTEENKKSNVNNAYSCRRCWGKIYWDKNFPKAEDAEKQAIADLIYHENHECGSNLTSPMISIYFSPNEGGNKHAPLSYAEGVNKDELMLEKVYGKEVSQEQVTPVDKDNNLTPWIIGGGVFLVGGLLLVWLINKINKTKKQK